MDDLFSFSPQQFERENSLNLPIPGFERDSSLTALAPVSFERDSSLNFFGTSSQTPFLLSENANGGEKSDIDNNDNDDLPSTPSLTYSERSGSENSSTEASACFSAEHANPFISGIHQEGTDISEQTTCSVFSEQTTPSTSPMLSCTDDAQSPCSPISFGTESTESSIQIPKEEPTEAATAEEEAADDNQENEEEESEETPFRVSVRRSASAAGQYKRRTSKRSSTEARTRSSKANQPRVSKQEAVDNKKAKKRAMNKVSASKYRQKRKQYFDDLERQNIDLKQTVQVAEQKVQMIKSENRNLKSQLSSLFQYLKTKEISLPTLPLFSGVFASNTGDEVPTSRTKKASKNKRTEMCSDIESPASESISRGKTGRKSKRIKTEPSSPFEENGDDDKPSHFQDQHARPFQPRFGSSSGSAMVMFAFVSLLSSVLMPTVSHSNSLDYLAATRNAEPAALNSTSQIAFASSSTGIKGSPGSVFSRLSFLTRSARPEVRTPEDWEGTVQPSDRNNQYVLSERDVWTPPVRASERTAVLI